MYLDFLPHPKPHHVARFQQVYRERFGVELSGTEALKLLTQLSGLVYLKEGDRLRREWEVTQEHEEK